MKHALIGYSYQHRVTSLLLSLMDVERKINSLEIEIDVEHKFDDVTVDLGSEQLFVQIKDFEDISLDQLEVSGNSINIKGKPHQLGPGKNAIFFKHIPLETDTNIIGFDSKLLDGVHIVSLDRIEIDQIITKLYSADQWRRNIIDQFLNGKLDKREFSIHKKDLPTIRFYSTELTEPTVNVSRSILLEEQLLLIEGKPGVGKSHLVNHLNKTFKNFILYRFWTSNQDPYKQERLKFENFIVDLSKRLFADFISRTSEEIITEIGNTGATFILDGLDHVENYNNVDLKRFVNFLDKLKEHTKVIVLSRPLSQRPDWKGQLLDNWNLDQTRQVLEELYHFDYEAVQHIYRLTLGYPILVRYIAEHYKKYGNVPDTGEFEDINSYYDEIMSRENGKQALALFLCTGSYLMRSEVDDLLGKETASIVQEFISERPYLFDLRLNRVTLFHDSFLTYLRNSKIDYASMSQKVSNHVYTSIMTGEKRYQSRLIHFELSKDQIKSIVQQYASLDYFRSQLSEAIDYEALQDFYQNIRQLLTKLEPSDLALAQYYDLALIFCLLMRDHTSSSNGFNYLYSRTLSKNGFQVDAITSSKNLFGMCYYLQTGDGTILENLKSQKNLETSELELELRRDLDQEDNYFRHYISPLTEKKIADAMHNQEFADHRENLVYILTDLYVNPKHGKICTELLGAIKNYMEGMEARATESLTKLISSSVFKWHRASLVLKDAKERLLAMGECSKSNDLLNLSLDGLIKKGRSKGDYEQWMEIMAFLRLALHQERKIDVAAISSFWTKYDKRHDYTLIKSPAALIVFEEIGYVDWRDSVRFITKVQLISEKGYRWLLGSYIVQKGVHFLEQLLDEFDYTELRISWLLLPPAFIEALPEFLFDHELLELMNYHKNGKSIEAHDIVNALKSNKLPLVKREFRMSGYSIRIECEDPEIELIQSTGITMQTYEREHYEDDHETIKVVDEKLKTILDVTRETDDNLWILPDPEKFQQFGQAMVRENIRAIFFQALTMKVRDMDSFHSTFNLPGNMVKIMYDSKVETDYRILFQSFCDFLELSHFTLMEKTARTDISA